MSKSTVTLLIVVGVFLVMGVSLYLYLAGQSEAAAVVGSISMATAAALSRGRTEEKISTAEEKIKEAEAAMASKDSAGAALDEALDSVDEAKTEMRKAESLVENMTEEEKLSLLREE